MGKVKVKTDIRRAQIAGATLKIIASKGIGALTTAGIAKEVGISEATLYRHFKSKDEILSVTVDRVVEGLNKNLENVSRGTLDEEAIVKLRRLFMMHLDFIEKNEGIPRLVYSEEIHINNENLKERLLMAINNYVATIEVIIKDGQKTGRIKKDLNPRETALTFIGMAQVTILRWSLSGFSFSLVDEGIRLWKNFEKCLSVK